MLEKAKTLSWLDEKKVLFFVSDLPPEALAGRTGQSADSSVSVTLEKLRAERQTLSPLEAT